MFKIIRKRSSFDNKFLACLPYDLSLEKFTEISKVGDSAGLNIVTRIYELLTTNVIDLSAEYLKYYREEYGKFEDFLYWKYNIESEVLSSLKECNSTNTYIALGELYSGGDHIGWLLYFDNPPSTFDALNNILYELNKGSEH